MDTISPLPSPCHILIVDDDPGIRTLIADFLNRNGCETETACDTRGMRARLESGSFHLIVLDLMMPGEDGLTALKKLLLDDKAPPVIMLSAVGTDIDKIIGLEIGADDYLAKPCNPQELLARIHRVLLRRQRSKPGEPRGAATPGLIRFAGWQMDLIGKTVIDPDGKFVYLTDGEFSLLRAMAERPRRVLSSDQLLDAARGEDCDLYDRAIDVQVGRLRRKLGTADIIRTVRNEGYMFVPKAA